MLRRQHSQNWADDTNNMTLMPLISKPFAAGRYVPKIGAIDLAWRGSSLSFMGTHPGHHSASCSRVCVRIREWVVARVPIRALAPYGLPPVGSATNKGKLQLRYESPEWRATATR